MSTSPISASNAFTGTSTFSTQLEQVLQRAVAIAALPLTQLNSNLSVLQGRATEVNTLNGKFASIQNSLTAISSSLTSASATNSTATVATVNTDATALPGTYTLTVTDPGSQTSALSKDGLTTVADPKNQSLSSSGSFTLTVGGTDYALAPASNSLNALAAAINASGAGVSATLVNVGPPSAPDYRLSIQNQSLGATTVQLNDGTDDLLNTLALGTSAQYQINGQPSTPISSDSQTVTLAPGLTANLLTAGTTTITVAQSSTALSNGLSSLVASYNAAVDELNNNKGTANGPLNADPLIATLTSALRQISTYTGGTGAAQNLADIGVTLDKTGHLSFDTGVFSTIAAQHPTDLAAFLGSTTTSGFLQVAGDAINTLEDPATGTFFSASTDLQTQITRQNATIAKETDHINLVQTSLTAKIAAADALISQLQSQVSYFTTLFASMENYGNSNKNQ